MPSQLPPPLALQNTERTEVLDICYTCYARFSRGELGFLCGAASLLHVAPRPLVAGESAVPDGKRITSLRMSAPCLCTAIVFTPSSSLNFSSMCMIGSWLILAVNVDATSSEPKIGELKIRRQSTWRPDSRERACRSRADIELSVEVVDTARGVVPPNNKLAFTSNSPCPEGRDTFG
jgi:hypothetical protein